MDAVRRIIELARAGRTRSDNALNTMFPRHAITFASIIQQTHHFDRVNGTNELRDSHAHLESLHVITCAPAVAWPCVINHTRTVENSKKVRLP
jgi:hypothetical protein